MITSGYFRPFLIPTQHIEGGETLCDHQPLVVYYYFLQWGPGKAHYLKREKVENK
jgi:hypothetical protein